MFKLYLITAILLFSTMEAKIYSGCGDNEKDARDELAKSIYVSVSSTFERNDSVFGDEVESNIRNNSKQSTNLKLINVVLENSEDNIICATISTLDLRKSLKGIVTEINNYNISTIPKNQKEAKIELKSKIEDCESGIKLASVLGRTSDISNLTRRVQSFKGRLEKIFAQNVKFNLPSNSLKIFIDGNRKAYKINEEIPLKIGEHQYIIKSKKHCDIQGNFNLDEDEVLVIDNIDLEDNLYPKITFTSNKDKQYIKFSVDGKTFAINKELTFKKCSGDLIYKAKYFDGSYKDFESGKVKLSAGIIKSIHFQFLSIGDIKALKNEAVPYKKGQRLEFLYSYGYVEKSNEFRKDTHNISFNMLNHKRFFRYGYGGLFGIDNLSNPDVKVMELYYLVAVQFSSFGENELPLRIAKTLSFIPYAGIEFGIGYHEFKFQDSKIFQYPRDGDEDANNNPTDYNWDWKRDSLVLKPIIGVDFILSKGFALKIFWEKNLFIDGRWFFGTGLSVEF